MPVDPAVIVVGSFRDSAPNVILIVLFDPVVIVVPSFVTANARPDQIRAIDDETMSRMRGVPHWRIVSVSSARRMSMTRSTPA